ncbi:serine/threonine protein kinase [Albidovulum inexpectatum]|uniref:non-specific serine/threonine protein kinase n=1 Tax=Albidovulum inexpectatum TaxID=196587 RepID=A0A2S5JGE4_9RHOB|nr:serine/threonine-protein kinase [Albidovulum inexpectatum]PPB80564.1 serine/threonine protein kinase [Albidovulum inexpectatum]
MTLNEPANGPEFEGTMDELQPGTTLLHGQYRITRFLNNGGFGITYLAKDSLDRDVVIKECFADAFCRRTNTIVTARSRAHQNELKSIIRHFIEEARRLAKLKHPNIVGVHQVFEDNDTAYMAIDYIEGKDLLDLLDDPATRLTPEQIVAITRKLLSAIGYVHDHGLLHRDISPDNILITKDGEPILIDFGAAREHAASGGRKHSALRVVKDGYSPQEFYIPGSEQGPWSDLYALAASLYHAIKGEPPVNGQARLAAIAEQRPDPYEPLAGRIPGYPPGFLEAIDKAMSTRPADRLQSAAEWLAMLDNPQAASAGADPESAVSWLMREAGADEDKAEDPKPVAAASAELAERKRGGGARAAVSVLALIAALGAGAYFYLDEQKDSAAPVAALPSSDVAATMSDSATEVAEQTSSAADQTGTAISAPAAATDPASAAVIEPVQTTDESVDGEPVPAPATAYDMAAPGSESPKPASATENDGAGAGAAMAAAEPAAVSQASVENVPADPAADPVADETPVVGITESQVDRAAAEAAEAAALPDASQDAAGGSEDSAPTEIVAPVEQAAVDAQPVIEEEKPAATGPVLQQQVEFALWDVEVPFDYETIARGNSRFASVTQVPESVAAEIGGWLRPGVEILTVNDKPLTEAAPFEIRILTDMVIDPDGKTRMTVRYKDPDTLRFDLALLAVPVIRRIGLADGTVLVAAMRDGVWQTRVAETGANADGVLQPGDIIRRETQTGAVFETAEAAEIAMAALVEMGAEAARLEVLRDGETLVAELPLARAPE